MLVLVSPTKTQKITEGESIHDSLFMPKTEAILDILKRYSKEEIQSKMKVSDKIATQVFDNFKTFSHSNPAIKTYQGSSFKAMDFENWSHEDCEYATEHVGILSALYGLLRPFDSIGLYRLDYLMPFEFDLYSYWQETLLEYLNAKNLPIINLASQEYSKMILEDKLEVPYYRLDFKEDSPKGFVTKSTYAKIARGTMTQLIVKNRIQTIEEIKQISFDGYSFNSDLSQENLIIFSR